MDTTAAPSAPSIAACRRFLLTVALALAALLRLAHWAAVRGEPFFARLAMDSQEYDRWARAIAAGDWLGSEPFFQAPLYPYALAVLYRLSGFSLDAVYLAQIALALAGVWALGRAGTEIGGPRVGGVAALLAAVYLPAVFFEVQVAKEGPALALVAFLLWALAAARRSGRLGAFAAAGAVLGLLALLRENFLLVAPFLLPFAGVPGAGIRRRLAPAAVFAGAFLAVLAPVAARNAALGGGWLPTTSQGGVNFWIGNNPQADGTYRPLTSGRQVPRLERSEAERLAEAAAGRELAAGEVSRYWLGRALAWVRAEPGAFLRLQLRKLALFASPYEWPDAVDYYWTKTRSPALALPLLEYGAALALAAIGAIALLLAGDLRRYALPLALAVLVALTTIAFFLFARYRLPAVPALLVLAAAGIDRLLVAWERGRRRAVALGAAAIAVAWAAPHLAGYAPRTDLVEYNLGRLAEEAEDPAAGAHYRAALAAEPRTFLAWLNLGNLAARAGRYGEARRAYERAVEIAPDSPEAWSNLGGTRLALGDLEGAARALDRALALDPGYAPALHNRDLVRARGATP